jgi:hypothetical protein
LVKTITDVVTREARIRGTAKTRRIVAQTGTTTGERTTVSVAVVIVGVTGAPAGEDVVTAITTDSN